MVLCPGFPPSIPLTLTAPKRVIAYIHDMFLLTRPAELNMRAKLYMRPAFGLAIKRLKRFVVNSAYTGDELRRFCRADAEIEMLRPAIRNVFGVSPEGRQGRGDSGPLRLISIGTIEPRKNLLAAARIRAALEARTNRKVELHLIGREGWGADADALRREPGVILHGYLSAADMIAHIDAADIFLSTSNDEGLGLPLLEIQYSGMAVVANDLPVFRESLGKSGLIINASSPDAAAEAIAGFISTPNWRAAQAQAASDNLARWNALATADAEAFVTRLLASQPQT
jgi:glycosyltransferase involved in cell wall biosynthesis